MDNLYFKAFDKYAPALSTLWPSQLQTLQEALDDYAETGKLRRMDDGFTRFALLMILCDLRHDGTEEGSE